MTSPRAVLSRIASWMPHRNVPRVARTVLIVDDEDSIVRFVDRTLRLAGYETQTASNGRAALVAAANAHEPFDLVLTDLMMPEMNGDELARQLRQRFPEMKVLYLTGYSDRLFAERTRLWEDEAFLDKPCSMTGLLEAVSLMSTGHIETKAPPGQTVADEVWA